MMRAILGRSIRRKLLAIVLLTTTITLLSAFGFVIYNDVRTFRRDSMESIAVIGRVTAENTVAELAFGDKDAAQKTLAHLAQTPGIISARLYDANDQLFSSYETRSEAIPPHAPPAGIRLFDKRQLTVTQAVEYQGEHYGTIAIVASTDALRAKIRQHLIVMLSFMTLLIGLSGILAMLLGRVISRPILDLAAVVHDISERHDYTVRVAKTSDDEIGTLGDGLNDMLQQIERRQRERDEADQRTREKSQFLANMSHELRTPLNAIIGFSEILQDRVADRLDEREVKFLENIHSSGQHLLGIVNDVLDLSKVEAGRMEVHPEEFSIEQAIEGVCHLMRGVSTRRKISFVIDLQQPLPLLYADPVKVKQVLYNLLSNAVKFSHENSVVTVRAVRRPAAASSLGVDSIEVSVADSGIGIEEKNHEMIFREFQQVDATISRQFEGTGLGLALVRKFVELHGGTVSLESALGKGSRFTVLLPVVYGQTASSVAASAATPRILVVEDDPAAFHTIESALANSGYSVLWARSGEEGLEIAEATMPEAITLDIILPGMDGWKVLRALKASRKTAHIPLIIVSVIENRELGFAFGADDYLTKPIDCDALIEKLRRVAPKSSEQNVDLLVIDGDRNLHRIIDEHLGPRGYRVSHAYGVDEGLQRATDEHPSLVIVDLMMQQMQGFDAALRLRNDPNTANVPIVALASEPLDADAARRLRGRMTTVMKKDELSSTYLSNVIDALVQRRSVSGGEA